jgi:hypothetical protein
MLDGGLGGGMAGGGLRRRRPMGMGSPLAMAAAQAGLQGRGGPMGYMPPKPRPSTRLPWVHSGHGYPPRATPPGGGLAQPDGGPGALAQPQPLPQLQPTGLGQIAAARMKRKPSPYGGGVAAY